MLKVVGRWRQGLLDSYNGSIALLDSQFKYGLIMIYVLYGIGVPIDLLKISNFYLMMIQTGIATPNTEKDMISEVPQSEWPCRNVQ